MKTNLTQRLADELEALRKEGLFKEERVITSPQSAHLRLASGQEVLNFCANNYLGLADHPALIQAAREGLDHHGLGMASVRFICGTQDLHRELEKKISRFLGTEDTILYSSCFDANGGLFETLLGEEDAVISDQLNHASIIDGIRLCKAKRFRYTNGNMEELEARLKESADCRHRLVATDGVFSMDGCLAKLPEICDLAKRYDATVMMDDCHATGFMGSNGRGTHEHLGVMGQVDLLTGTLGKALGGASGGYTSGKKEVIQWLRQRSRPYLFSNALAPPIVAASIKALELVEQDEEPRRRLHENARHFRQALQAQGFRLVPGEHPIIPILLGEATLAQRFAAKALERGIYVIGFSFPVVPRGQARIRTQMSASHTREDLDRAVEVFTTVGKELGVL